MKSAVFLDRDGVINIKAPRDGYITRWEDFKFLPGVAEAIALLNRAGFLVIVVTNQRCVARGLLSASDLTSIHLKMTESLASAGAHLNATYFCPHELDPPCTCRKPAPGMLFKAASEHGIDLPNSWMIGDSDSDSEAGRRAGCHTIMISTQHRNTAGSTDHFAESLLSATQIILSFPKS